MFLAPIYTAANDLNEAQIRGREFVVERQLPGNGN